MKLYNITYSTAHEDSLTIIVEADSVQEAKDFFQKILTTNTYFKTKLGEVDMIVLSSTIKINKVTVYKK